MRLDNKIAIITGGASNMGAADACLFAREGATVVVADVLDAQAEQVVAEITEAGGAAHYLHLDVSDPEQWDRGVAETVSRFGGVDILINNAGISGAGVPDVTDIDAFDRLIGINLRGAFLGIRAVVPHMAGRGGSIVNISSICGLTGTPGIHLGYNASKGGIYALTKAAAAQYGPLGIRVNSILPGTMPSMINPAAEKVGDWTIQRIPLGRRGEAAEVANATLFLASDEASYISGAELYVDGGYLAA